MQDLPYNAEFESALLIGILQDPELLIQVNQLVNEEDFYKFSNKEIFKVLNSVPIDEIDSLVIQDKLSEDTKVQFEKLIREGDYILPSLSNILVYAEEIRSKSILRQCIRTGQEIASIGMRPGIHAEDALRELEHQFANFIYTRVQNSTESSTKEAFESFMNNLGKKIDHEGTKSGFFAIDMMLHRLDGLIVLAARPGVGKTALAINIARNVAEYDNVLFFSLEQSQEQVFERMLAAEAEINLEEIRTAAFLADREAVDRIANVKPHMIELMDHIHVDERAALSSSHIISTARQKKVEKGSIGLVVVDYLHIMALDSGPKVDTLGDAVKELRALGKELGCPVLLLAQLSRQPERVEAGDDNRKVRRRPELTDLRSSGEIEQSSDVVIFLYRESYFNEAPPMEDTVEVVIKKNRSGRIGTVMLDWYPAWVKFKDQRYA